MKTQKMLVGMLILGIVFIVLVIPGRAQKPEPLQPSSVTDAVGTAFSYQGQLKKDGGLVNGTCDFEFSLWNQVGTGTPPTGGTQIGGTQSKSGVTVTDGLFTVSLDFGSTAFNGEARYLQTAVQCAGDSGFNALSPRQTLYAALYTLGLKPGAIISNTEGTILTIQNRGSVAGVSGIYVDVGEPELYVQHSRHPSGIAGGNAGSLSANSEY